MGVTNRKDPDRLYRAYGQQFSLSLIKTDIIFNGTEMRFFVRFKKGVKLIPHSWIPFFLLKKFY